MQIARVLPSFIHQCSVIHSTDTNLHQGKQIKISPSWSLLSSGGRNLVGILHEQTPF